MNKNDSGMKKTLKMNVVFVFNKCIIVVYILD